MQVERIEVGDIVLVTSPDGGYLNIVAEVLNCSHTQWTFKKQDTGQIVITSLNVVVTLISKGGLWQPISTAPTDGSWVWGFAPANSNSPNALQATCRYHPDAGWCADEFRSFTHWVPLRSMYLPAPLLE